MVTKKRFIFANILASFGFFVVCSNNAVAKRIYLESELPVTVPVDPAVLSYLADHLEPTECSKLSTFLALHNTNSHWESKSKNKTALRGRVVKSFACHRMLKLWNENIASTEADSRLDGAEYVENIVIAGLIQIERDDLASWLQKLALEKRRHEISLLNADWEKHRRSGSEDIHQDQQQEFGLQNSSDTISQNSTKSGKHDSKNDRIFSGFDAKTHKNLTDDLDSDIDSDDDEDVELLEDVPNELHNVILFALCGLLSIPIVGIAIWYCSMRTPTPRYPNRFKRRLSMALDNNDWQISANGYSKLSENA